MKRIIVHLIRGKAGEEHERITHELTDRFDSFPIHDRIVPHLTLKRWFEFTDEQMAPVYDFLDAFCAGRAQSEYTLKGFNHFGADVIYMDVLPSKETEETVRELMRGLRTVKDMTFDEYDEIDGDLHATVAMGALKPFDFNQLWNHLTENEHPYFEMKFDNIAVLKREEDRWVPDRVWELKP